MWGSSRYPVEDAPQGFEGRSFLSVTYYTWLEQGREFNPSPEVLLNISNALLLDEDERKHLFNLANVDLASAGVVQNNERSDIRFVQTIVDQLYYPLFITNEATDVIAWNSPPMLVTTQVPNFRYRIVSICFVPGMRSKISKTLETGSKSWRIKN